MDHATLTDNSGRKADFRNTVLILTSNAGSREMSAASIGFADGETGTKAKTAVERVFSPEFRNRLDAIVTFKSLTPEAMETIVEKFIMQLESQLKDRKVAIALTPGSACVARAKGLRPEDGRAPARPRDSARRARSVDRSDSVRQARERRAPSRSESATIR